MKNSITLLVHTTVWLGETIEKPASDPFLNKLGFRQVSMKTRTYVARVFGVNYTDSCNRTRSFNFFSN